MKEWAEDCTQVHHIVQYVVKQQIESCVSYKELLKKPNIECLKPSLNHQQRMLR